MRRQKFAVFKKVLSQKSIISKSKSPITTVVVGPLEFSKILQSIFEYLTVGELLEARLVSQKWSLISCELLQYKVALRIRNWSDVENISNDRFTPLLKKAIILDADFPLPLDSKRISGSGFYNLSPHTELLTVACNLNADEWMKILFNIFPNLKELKISGHVPYEALINDTTIRQIKFLPVLQLKSISFNTKHKRSEQLFIRKFTKDLFSILPNLQCINWEDFDNASSFPDILCKAMFQCLMLTKSITNITQFSCPNLILGLKELSELSRANYRFQRLEISIGANVNSHFLGEFLAIFEETLESLRLGFRETFSITVKINEDNKFKKLRAIYLEDYKRNLQFITNLFSLRKLVLLNSSVERGFCVDWTDEDLSQLPELEIFECYSLPGRKLSPTPTTAVARLSLYFPKLRILRLQSLDDKCLRRIFRNFTFLEELRAPSGTFTDDAFKSLTAAAKFIKHVESVGILKAPSTLQYSYDMNNLNCNSLRRLELDSNYITDEFITKGIIKWKGIRHLGLKNCRIQHSTITRLIMEMDLHCFKLESCDLISDFPEIKNPYIHKESGVKATKAIFRDVSFSNTTTTFGSSSGDDNSINTNDTEETIISTGTGTTVTGSIGDKGLDIHEYNVFMTYGDIKKWRKNLIHSLIIPQWQYLFQ